MHDQGRPLSPDEERGLEEGILNMLLDERGLWSADEVAREAGGDPIEAEDALTRLHAEGLVHRVEGFVFATRPAARAERLLG
jgi:hypothetical protein